MQNLEMKMNENPSNTGSLFCEDCVAELIIVMDRQKFYVNPQYNKDWDIAWHEFHNVKYIVPEILKFIYDEDYRSALVCPYCSGIGKIVPMQNGMLDVKLLRASLVPDKPRVAGYRCVNCEGIFASQSCVSKLDDHGSYICGDCAVCAQEK